MPADTECFFGKHKPAFMLKKASRDNYDIFFFNSHSKGTFFIVMAIFRIDAKIEIFYIGTQNKSLFNLA